MANFAIIFLSGVSFIYTKRKREDKMVTIRELKKSYKKFHVLDGLNMTINKGDVYGFLGKNGCGKTTTMNIICNIVPKDEGEIILGEVPGDKIKIGYLPETPALFDYMNGYEYLEYIAACAKYRGDVKARVAEVLDITGMTEGGKRRIKGYSRGMNQRLGIAAAIFDNPDLLILDEPTSALDPEGRAEVISIIRSLSETGATILLCTHILSDVERVANRIGIMSGGKLAIEDTIINVENRFRHNSVEVSLGSLNENVQNLLKNAEFVSDVEFFPASGLAVLDVDDPDEGMIRTMRLLSENNISPLKIQVTRPTLEQIYINTVGEVGGERA